LRSTIDEFRLIECYPRAFRVISGIQRDLGVTAGISLTGHDDDLIRRGERPIVAPEHFDQLEYRYPASRILDRRKLGYSDGCRQDHFLPKNTDEILSLLIIK